MSDLVQRVEPFKTQITAIQVKLSGSKDYVNLNDTAENSDDKGGPHISSCEFLSSLKNLKLP